MKNILLITHASLGHLRTRSDLSFFHYDWFRKGMMISPEIEFDNTSGHLSALLLTAKELMDMPRDDIRQKILDAALYLQDECGVDCLQLGALTTSVTSGGVWLTEQPEFTGYVTHGDSYTASIVEQNVYKLLDLLDEEIYCMNIAIVGAYGIIGEAVSKLLVPVCYHAVLVGPDEDKLRSLGSCFKKGYTLSTELDITDADVVITATNHPTALLDSRHLKKNALIVDVSQPPNLSHSVCSKRKDIIRVDGGLVSFPNTCFITPGLPSDKMFACVTECIMQAMEDDKHHHVGSIDMQHLKVTERWGKKHGFVLKELTNFGKSVVF